MSADAEGLKNFRSIFCQGHPSTGRCTYDKLPDETPCNPIANAAKLSSCQNVPVMQFLSCSPALKGDDGRQFTVQERLLEPGCEQMVIATNACLTVSHVAHKAKQRFSSTEDMCQNGLCVGRAVCPRSIRNFDLITALNRPSTGSLRTVRCCV